MGCDGSSGGVSRGENNTGGNGYTLKYKLKETDTAYINFNNDKVQNFTKNIEVKLEGDNFDLYTNEGKIAGKVIRITKNDNIKISMKNVTNEFLKVYTININKSSIKNNNELIESSYAPIIVAPSQGVGVAEIKNLENVLPEAFKSNILKIFIKDGKKDILKRFKKVYYVNSQSDPSRKYSIALSSSLLDLLVTTNFTIDTYNKGNPLFLKLYGLEQFEEEGVDKVNLVGLEVSISTVSDLPYINLANSQNSTIVSNNSTINFRPNSFTLREI